MNAKAKRHAWLEEYKCCGCTFMAPTKRELPGYCPVHGNNRLRTIKMLCAANMQMGHAR